LLSINPPFKTLAGAERFGGVEFIYRLNTWIALLHCVILSLCVDGLESFVFTNWLLLVLILGAKN